MGGSPELTLLIILCASVAGAAGKCVRVENNDMTEYSCVGGQLSDLNDLPDSCERIRISRMPISRITVDTFSRFGSTLLILDCSQCGVIDIEPGAFQQLRNLQLLTLDGNRFSIIKESWFRGLDYLTYLNLNYNQIQSIEDGFFKNLPSLVDLRLSGNKLQCLNLEAVSHLTKLKRIFFTENPEFQCQNAVSAFLENRGVGFAPRTSVLVPPATPAYNERLPPITTTPPAQPEIPDEPPIVQSSEKIIYKNISPTPYWTTVVDYVEMTTVRPSTSRSYYDDSLPSNPTDRERDWPWNMERTTAVLYGDGDYWTDENVVVQSHSIDGATTESSMPPVQPSEPGAIHIVQPLTPTSLTSLMMTSTPTSTSTTTTTDKPLPICPTNNSSSSHHRSLQTIVIVLFMAVTWDILVERF